MLSTFEKGCQFSLQPRLKVSSFRKGDFSPVLDAEGLGKRMRSRWIVVQMRNEQWYHHLFQRVNPRPHILYLMGNLSLLDKKILWVVGPRDPSAYALEVMNDFFSHVSQYDLVTISWWAKWIDTTCHELSQRYDIPTIVVVGGGLKFYRDDKYFRKRLEEILEKGGLLISQFRLNQSPFDRTFPARNKIIAGLANVVFVPAAGERSGSLLTVDFACEIGTPVYSVPGSIYEPTCAGTNRYMMQKKITPICLFEPMLDAYFERKDAKLNTKLVNNVGGESLENVELTSEEEQLVNLIKVGEESVAKLIEWTGRPIEKILSLVTWLELQAIIKEESPWKYTIV